MSVRQLGPLRVVVTGGTDGKGAGDGPAIVLLHGFGAPGDDLVPLGRAVAAPPGSRWVFPEAPLAPIALMGGRAWWEIDLVKLQRSLELGEPRDLSREQPAALPAARKAVLALLDALETDLGVPSRRVVLGGFSQGAMLALDVALHDPRPLAGLALLSGSLLNEDEWLPRMKSRAGLGILQSHGRADPILGFAAAERLRDALSAAGCAVTWVPFAGQHEIPPPVTTALGSFVQHALG